MLPVDFEYRNLVLGKPENMTDEECSSLPVHRTQDGRWISKWRLNKEELDLIAQTGEIFFIITSDVHPPICPMIENPFGGGDYPRLGDVVKGKVVVAVDKKDEVYEIEGRIEDVNGLLVVNIANRTKVPFYLVQEAEFISRV